jgi:hypothetical protein
MKHKNFNITAQVYRKDDKSKQNLLINEIYQGFSSEEALSNFRLHFPSIEFSLIKILSVEEIDNEL